MRTIQQFLLSFILTGAVMAIDTDTQAYRDSLKQHPNQAVQAAVQQYNQGLCTVADILRAEEKHLAEELATTDKTHYTALAEQLIRNYKEQIRLEETVSGGSSTHSLQLRQKLYALEIDVLKNSHCPPIYLSMKQLLLTAAIAALLVPLHAQPAPETGTLLEWQNADAPVALVEEMDAPALSTPGRLSVRILATEDCILREGTILLLEAEGIPRADGGLPRRWILNLAKLKQLRSLHPRQEVLQATASASAFASPAGMSTFSWSERSSWSDIVRHHTDKGISDEGLRRIPIICRENFTPHSRRFEESGKWYEEYTMVCDMALPESWSKGYLPGERIVLHWPVVGVSGPDPSPEEQKALADKALRMGDFLLTTRFERQGNTLHLYREDCRTIPGHKRNTDRVSALLSQEKEPEVRLQLSEYSPYMPDAAARSAQPLERNCHFVYKGLQTHDTLLRCKYISRQIIAIPDAGLSHLYKCEYNVVEILECLKGEGTPKRRISFWRKVEGCKLSPGTYAAEGEFFLGFNQGDAEWLPTENLTYIGRDDFRFMRLPAGQYSEAVQKVMQEYPELFGKEKPVERQESIDTEQARQIALQALREQQYEASTAYNVQGLGSYLYVYPAKGCGAHVLLHPDGRLARIFTPDAE